ncbi:DUF4325 domain-containing protein [Geomonas sp. Red32]|uniref:STAS-like domain-containing protein n=1 Tax=Geomonas sp. Red32 TaxID=2912856 RepID=UPI00202CE93C|nr:DUF4325 domain-containing protein [Geomonas sp. Red32]MCM0084463.1 DUF4325 domain-containing protein [Geomonas sp. Red32]
MVTVVLPSDCRLTNLVRAINYYRLNENVCRELQFKVPNYCYLDCASISFLATWGLKQLSNGGKIDFVGSPRVLQYLSRMDLFKILDLGYEEIFKRKPEVGRFITIKTIKEGQDAYDAVNSICDLLTHLFENARSILPAFEWAANEIMDNIIIHSETKAPGAVCAQYREDIQRLEIGIFDSGRGIKNSLEESKVLRDHQQAITEALKRGVTRNLSIGQGNGLAGSREIIIQNQGSLNIWTGDAEYKILNGKEIGTSNHSFTMGTGLLLSLDVNRPVDLSNTFIGKPSWNYLNAECERIAEMGGIKVVDECFHTGVRETAKKLRRKILTMLPDIEDKLNIDFSGITRASSSFLDELLGRLVQEIGTDTFFEKVAITNANQDLIDMANVVIKQRIVGLEGVKEPSNRLMRWIKRM